MGQRFLFSMVLMAFGGIFFSPISFAINDNANCGPGKSMAQSENAIITLNISSSVTYAAATTSSTSGCEGPFVAASLEEMMESFLVLHYNQLSEEVAQGQGMHWEALAKMLGCQEGGSEKLMNSMHEAYSDFFDPSLWHPDTTSPAKQLAQKIQIHLSKDPQLSQMCSAAAS